MSVIVMLTLDLQRDAAAIVELVNDAVSEYTLGHANPELKSEFSPVARLDLVYCLGDSVNDPSIFVHIDARENSKPDGVWSHSEIRIMEFLHWSGPLREVSPDSPLTIVTFDGERIATDSWTDLYEYVGDFLVSCLKSMRENGAFTSLPIRARGELGVTEIGGSFGWPLYENRGDENFIG